MTPAAAQTARRAPRLPVNTDGAGVDAVLRGGRVTFTFGDQAARRFARIAGRSVEVDCTHLERLGGTGWPIESDGEGAPVRAPRDRATFGVSVGGGRFDLCSVTLGKFGQSGNPPVADVPVSPRGAAYLSRQQTAGLVLTVAGVAETSSGRPASMRQLKQSVHTPITRLSRPDARPPKNKLGYWTNGRDEITVSALAFDGQLFFFRAFSRTAVVTTNLLGWLEHSSPTF